jgi:hypothetical protein
MLRREASSFWVLGVGRRLEFVFEAAWWKGDFCNRGHGEGGGVGRN